MLASIPAFFGLKTPGDIAWAHGVNSRRLLDDYAGAPDTHMIEGDISWLPEAGGVMMAHPPETRSDLAFESWIEGVAAARKGAKLDFKHPAAIAPCLAKLEAMRGSGRLDIPILLNADVLQGPGGGAPSFEAEAFVERCSTFDGAGLSLGWTTQYVKGGAFAEASVVAMLRLASPVAERATLCLRACYLSASAASLARLLAAEGSWLTIWNGRHDPVVTPSEARRLTDPARSFYDLIDAQGLPIR